MNNNKLHLFLALLVIPFLTACPGGGSKSGGGGDPTGFYSGTERISFGGGPFASGTLRMKVGGALGAQVVITDGGGFEFFGSWNGNNFNASGTQFGCNTYRYTGTFDGDTAKGDIRGTRCDGVAANGSFEMKKTGDLSGRVQLGGQTIEQKYTRN